MGHTSSHYVPVSDIIRPQLVGVRPFVYTPTGLHGMQHSHQVNQHFNYSQQYHLRSQQTNHQMIQCQQQQTTNDYQPQTLIPYNQLLPEQLSNQQQLSVAEIQQQHNSSSAVQQHQQIKAQEGAQQPETRHFLFHHPHLNTNKPCEMTPSQTQQHEPLKEHRLETKELYPKEHKDGELSQKQWEELTVKYQHQQQEQQQQKGLEQQHRQKQQHRQHKEQRKQQKQKEQQPLNKQELQQQQQQQLNKKEIQTLNTNSLKQTEPMLTAISNQATQIQNKKKINAKSRKDHQTSTDQKSADKSFDCLESYQKHQIALQESNWEIFAAITSASDETVTVPTQTESKSALKEFSHDFSITSDGKIDSETGVKGCKSPCPSRKSDEVVHDQSNEKLTENSDNSTEVKENKSPWPSRKNDKTVEDQSNEKITDSSNNSTDVKENKSPWPSRKNDKIVNDQSNEKITDSSNNSTEVKENKSPWPSRMNDKTFKDESNEKITDSSSNNSTEVKENKSPWPSRKNDKTVNDQSNEKITDSSNNSTEVKENKSPWPSRKNDKTVDDQSNKKIPDSSNNSTEVKENKSPWPSRKNDTIVHDQSSEKTKESCDNSTEVRERKSPWPSRKNDRIVHDQYGEKIKESSENSTEVKERKSPWPSTKNDKVVHSQSNGKITERIEELKQSKQQIKSKISISNNAKAEDSKRVLSLKHGEIVMKEKDADLKLTKEQDQLQQEKMDQPKSLQEKKEQRKDMRKKMCDKIRSLPPKEKLLLLQQQIKRQAEALERLGQSRTKLGMRNESKNSECHKIPKKGLNGEAKISVQDIKTKENTLSEIKSDPVVSSEVQLLMKREDITCSLASKKTQEGLKMTEKDEQTTLKRSPSKIRLFQRMNMHEDETETKEKRAKLDTDESPLHHFTNNTVSSKLPHITVANVDSLNSKTCDDNNDINSNTKTKTKINQGNGQRSKSPKKTSNLIMTSNEASSNLFAMNNQINKKCVLAQTATKDDRTQTTIKDGLIPRTTASPPPTIIDNEVSEKISNRCKKSDKMKEVTNNFHTQSNEEVNCHSLDKQNMDIIVQERLKEHPDTVIFNEKKKLPKLVGQEKQKLSPLVVDSKLANVSSNVKVPERNFKVELAAIFNQTGLIRPIPKLPLQSIPSHGVVPEFSPMSIPSQFSHLQPQVNNMQQFQTFTNNQFQPIMRPEAGIGRKVNFVFNHPVLPPMPPGHILPQNDTYTTNTHYDPVMVPNPLLVGVPGITGHTPHHIARPIPHLPTQPWQNMALPSMMHPRMAHFPPAHPPVLPNIGMNRNAPEFYSKMPERLPKIQPDSPFHLPYNNLLNVQMKFAGRNLVDDGSFPITQFQNDFSTNRPAFSISNRDIQGYGPVSSSNIISEEFSAMHSGPVVHSKSYLPSKVFLTHESDKGDSITNDGGIRTAEALDLVDKIEKNCHCPQHLTLKRDGSFKPSVKIPTFNRTVRELISVPFTSDESRLLYLLKKRHQGHPIAQEWLLVCNGLLTSHFRKLWDPPCKDEDFQEVSEDRT